MEKVAGIVAEYNPFHRGHAHHIAETRRRLGADCAVVCVLSGDFVQRGEAAILPKHLRAAAALRGGADLVLELPLPWSLASAEGFARGAVGLVAATGVVTHLSFGSECGDAKTLQTISDAMATAAYGEALRAALKTGVSYAAACQTALGAIPEAQALQSPNDLLGVAYLNAMRELDAALSPIAIRRVGAQHDGAGTGAFRAASELRAGLRAGADVSAFLPDGMTIRTDDLPDPALLETAILGRLRMLPPEAFAALPDMGEGLDHTLYRAVHDCAALAEIHAAAKSKRYALSRIRRLTLCAALGVRGNLSRNPPSYLRVLAANETGRALLRRMKRTAALPIITKPAAAKTLSDGARDVFALTASAHDLYVLGYADPARRRPGEDWRTGPVLEDIS